MYVILLFMGHHINGAEQGFKHSDIPTIHLNLNKDIHRLWCLHEMLISYFMHIPISILMTCTHIASIFAIFMLFPNMDTGRFLLCTAGRRERRCKERLCGVYRRQHLLKDLCSGNCRFPYDKFRLVERTVVLTWVMHVRSQEKWLDHPSFLISGSF